MDDGKFYCWLNFQQKHTHEVRSYKKNNANANENIINKLNEKKKYFMNDESIKSIFM